MKRLNSHPRSKFFAAALLALVILMPSMVLASDPPVNGVSYRTARSIALRARHGKLTKNFEQKQWRGIWVYDFNILGDDKVVHEVVVDMVTGKVLLGAPKKHVSKKHKRSKKILPSKAVPTAVGPTPTVALK